MQACLLRTVAKKFYDYVPGIGSFGERYLFGHLEWISELIKWLAEI
jgi:hypothetical protein